MSFLGEVWLFIFHLWNRIFMFFRMNNHTYLFRNKNSTYLITFSGTFALLLAWFINLLFFLRRDGAPLHANSDSVKQNLYYLIWNFIIRLFSSLQFEVSFLTLTWGYAFLHFEREKERENHQWKRNVNQLPPVWVLTRDNLDVCPDLQTFGILTEPPS